MSIFFMSRKLLMKILLNAKTMRKFFFLILCNYCDQKHNLATFCACRSLGIARQGLGWPVVKRSKIGIFDTIVREAVVSPHNGCPIYGPLKPLGSIYCDLQGVSGVPISPWYWETLASRGKVESADRNAFTDLAWERICPSPVGSCVWALTNATVP